MTVKVGSKYRYKNTPPITEEPRVLDLAVVEKEEGSPPAVSARVRIAPERGGVAIWSQPLFNDPASHNLRLFLSRVFSLQEISAAEIDRRAGVGRLKYETSNDAPSIWRKLKQVLIQRTAVDLDDEVRSEYGAAPLGVDRLYLDTPATLPIRIGRIGSHLSTWRLRYQTDDRVRLTHPILRNRKDVAYRLEEELTEILGVRSFRTNIMAASVVVRFNPRRINVYRLLRHLERAVPHLVDGLEGPPPSTRFFASSTLITTAFAAQFFVPTLIPFTLAGVAIYGFPNVISAAKLLARGKIGLPVLYTGTLTFTLLSGMPFSAAMMALLMQLWPRLAYQTMTKSQRRLFATHRQRPSWARLVHAEGLEFEVDIERLKVGDTIAVHEGEIVPVDGVILGGLAAVDQEALTGRAGALDKAPGRPCLCFHLCPRREHRGASQQNRDRHFGRIYRYPIAAWADRPSTLRGRGGRSG